MHFLHLEVVLDDLPQVHHSLRPRGSQHLFTQDVVDPEASLVRQGVLEFLEALLGDVLVEVCLLYTSPSPRDGLLSRMPSSA